MPYIDIANIVISSIIQAFILSSLQILQKHITLMYNSLKCINRSNVGKMSTEWLIISYEISYNKWTKLEEKPCTLHIY